MSHQVILSYQGVSIQVQAQCDTAASALCRIDKTIERIRQTAKTLRTEQVQEYEQYLLQSKEIIQRKIEKFKQEAAAYQNRQTMNPREYDLVVERLRTQAKDLAMTASELTGSKLRAIDQMIEEGLLRAGDDVFERMHQKEHGFQLLSQATLEKINAIEDISLRELVFLAAKEHDDMDYDALLRLGQEKYDELLGRSKKKAVEELSEEMRTAGVDAETVAKVTSSDKSIDDVTAMASTAIVDEKVRKETLKVIIKAIKSRGFIVDTRNNLKIDKERNVVRLVTMKASGQKAEFEIQLNGKFMYRFDGYEGQACRKDIEPFMNDLASIYDINVLHEEVIWDNPDKIQMKQYQHHKTKTN